jgi:hypothetical protein
MQRLQGMSDQQPSTTEMPPEMAEPSAPMTEPPRDGRLMQFGRKHPVLTVAGLAGVGLVGGIEMTAGVLVGAGVTALIRRRDRTARLREGTHAEQARPPEAPHEGPGRMRRMLERAPQDLLAWRERARAVVMAARGEIHAPAEHRNSAS